MDFYDPQPKLTNSLFFKNVHVNTHDTIMRPLRWNHRKCSVKQIRKEKEKAAVAKLNRKHMCGPQYALFLTYLITDFDDHMEIIFLP